MSTQRQQFRALINAPELLLLPGAYDALSARMIEAAGFSAMVAGGYAAVGSLLGQADMGQSNMRDLADHYARICAAVEIPVYADADTGFGGVHNIRQAVRAFEDAGVAGIFLNDQVFPNRCGYLPGKAVVPIEEMMARIHAALDARRDSSLVICARTDIFSIEGESAAIERCLQFMEAGVDMAKPQGIDSYMGICKVCRTVPGPHFATLSQAAGETGLSFEALRQAGAAAATLPSIALFAAAHGVTAMLRALKSAQGVADVREHLIPLPDYYGLTRLKELHERETDLMQRAISGAAQARANTKLPARD
ncbi:isocitrate lyase/phosphoenolpyruvate mutase family protein [Candidimonas humi]|uniref:Oxaloacetate decarboxylase n=1 Tax=Candidimonas humi TaxID=683355 RepID=A0ABV8NZN6_9BURK|nr:isocitrate lyase/phosphoenolpyruvate mutase family protein [Candidimonas humi]